MATQYDFLFFSKFPAFLFILIYDMPQTMTKKQAISCPMYNSASKYIVINGYTNSKLITLDTGR